MVRETKVKTGLLLTDHCPTGPMFRAQVRTVLIDRIRTRIDHVARVTQAELILMVELQIQGIDHFQDRQILRTEAHSQDQVVVALDQVFRDHHPVVEVLV